MKWLKLVVHFPSFYSYRVPEYSSQYALALPLVAPSTIKLAIVSTAIRVSGRVEEGKRIFDYIRDAKVGIKLPEAIAINSVFIKRLKKKEGISISIEGVGKVIQTDKGITIYTDTEVPVFKIGGKTPRGYYIPAKARVQIGKSTVEVSDLIIWGKDLKITNKNSRDLRPLKLTEEDKKNPSKQEQEQKKRELKAKKERFEKEYRGKLETFLFRYKRKLPVSTLYSGDFTIYTLGKFNVIEPKNKQELRFENISTLASGFQESFGVREYVHFSGSVEIYIGLPDNTPDCLAKYATQIRYLGTSDSIVYVKTAEWVDDVPRNIIVPSNISDIPAGSHIYPVKDFSEKATFEQINTYSPKTARDPYITKYYYIKLSRRPIEGSNWKVLFIS